MCESLLEFSATLLASIGRCAAAPGLQLPDPEFRPLALRLLALQYDHNAALRRMCQVRGLTPERITDWRTIPAMPTASFKELEVTCLAPALRTRVFLSSGTTAQRPSRHFHSAESLALYEASLLAWSARRLLTDGEAVSGGELQTAEGDGTRPRQGRVPGRWLSLTPSPDAAPHSSLAHMLGAIGRACGAAGGGFAGRVGRDGAWEVDVERAMDFLHRAEADSQPALVLGTAFNFVHLLDALAAAGRHFRLPRGSRVMETGGYKGRSRELEPAALHALLAGRLGVAPDCIVREYGMCELSSQAYDRAAGSGAPARDVFHFPPWARALVVSPETGTEVSDGEVGLLRVVDLANVFSALAVQTEDLAVRRGGGFTLLGRAPLAEPRGCSLMSLAPTELRT